MAKRIIIAGGGTGGHIFPAIAIANALKRNDPSVDLLFVGARDRMEMEKIPQAGFRIIGLDIAGFNRSSLMKNISLPFKLIKSFFQVRQIMSEFHPDAVIGVGGYSSYPVLKYAQTKGIKTFIHESNSFAGKSNIMLGKKATKVFVASTGMEKFFPAQKITVSGNPVRKIFTQPVSKEEALKFFSLEKGKKTVLVVGGSLGAASINSAIDKGLDKLIAAGMQLIWQTGKLYVEKATERAVENKEIWVNAFIDRMDYAYAAADIVVSRSGAMAIAELAVVKKPSLFVPYPHAAEDHQTANARMLFERGAAWMLPDSQVDQLVQRVLELAANENEQLKMTSNISVLGIHDADERIAKEILNSIKN